MAYGGWGLRLVPQTHDDRHDEHLYQPVAGVYRGHFPRRVLPEDRSHENEDGEPDPHRQTEMNRAQHPDDAEQGHESEDYEREDEAPRKLDDQFPPGHLRARHRGGGVQAARPHPRLEEQQRTVPQPAQHEQDDSRYEDSQVVHVQHRASKEWGVRERG